MFNLGLIVNPYAGIGGALALKGSDGADIRERALSQGAEKRANEKARLALRELSTLSDRVRIVTAAGEMGEDIARAEGFNVEVVYAASNTQTEPDDTKRAAEAIISRGPDLLMFAGGDGTARNIFDVLEQAVPVIGVPAGVKIHSGVYAVTPKSAGRVVASMILGEIVSVSHAEVKDIDEDAFRSGQVRARLYGEMLVPEALRYIQSVKSGSKESEPLVLADIAAHVTELMEDDEAFSFVMGSGSTVAAVMEELRLDNSLLGVDVVRQNQLVLSDVTESQLFDYVNAHPCKLVVTVIGGQGHILGRGNQQLSPRVIRAIGKDNIIIVATKTKLEQLERRPLLVDSGDDEVNKMMAGITTVITGYKDEVFYTIANVDEE